MRVVLGKLGTPIYGYCNNSRKCDIRPIDGYPLFGYDSLRYLSKVFIMPPTFTWNIGTAYDLLISLHVLHQPDRFGLRPAWAAGVRNRLQPDERRFLQSA